MAYRYGSREQVNLFPNCIEDYVGPQDPVRVYDLFVDQLDFTLIGISENHSKVGNSQYDPRSMLKLLLYGYSYGIRSSRKLEQALHHNISFMWLMGGMKPDFKTISEFRRNNKFTLKQLLKQCARMCMKLGLIEGNTIFIDSTKIRANASLKNQWTEDKCEKVLERIDARIEELIEECEKADADERHQESLIEQQVLQQKDLKEKVKNILKELNDKQRKTLNTIDPDCVSTKSIHGAYAGYNCHIAVDEKNGLIVNAEPVSSAVDRNALSEQTDKAVEVMGKKCAYVVADTGYSDTSDIGKIFDQGITPVVSLQKEIRTEGFLYNKEDDTYTCPEGEIFYRSKTIYKKKWVYYRPKKHLVCLECSRFGTCTKSKNGRIYSKSLLEPIANKIKETCEQLQHVYKRRKEVVEHPFGHIRRNLNMNSFLLRHLDGANAELSIIATVFNIRRMITIYKTVEGVKKAFAI